MYLIVIELELSISNSKESIAIKYNDKYESMLL